MKKIKIEKIQSREVLDSRGFPTVETEIMVSGKMYRGLVPSGASTGEGEALELRDGDKKRFHGKGVLKAVQNVQNEISKLVLGKEFESAKDLDQTMLSFDGTDYKTKLGANSILSVSMAAYRAQADLEGKKLFESISHHYGSKGVTLPVPLMNILNGGKHADNGLAIQEFMIMPVGFSSFKEALRAGSEIFHTLKKILHQKNLSTAVGDEGGFAPNLGLEHSHEKALNLILEAIEKAGYRAGDQVKLALDCAASEFYQKNENLYEFEGKKKTSSEMISQYEAWSKKYPLVSIEDGLAESDWSGWSEFQKKLGSTLQIVGDDLFVTNVRYLKKGIEEKAANSILIKLNQIGTVTETLETMRLAREHQFTQVVSHRSGETEDSFIADLAVGTDAGQIKTGSLCRTDRIAKYNQLLRIEEILGGGAKYLGNNFRS